MRASILLIAALLPLLSGCLTITAMALDGDDEFVKSAMKADLQLGFAVAHAAAEQAANEERWRRERVLGSRKPYICRSNHDHRMRVDAETYDRAINRCLRQANRYRKTSGCTCDPAW